MSDQTMTAEFVGVKRVMAGEDLSPFIDLAAKFTQEFQLPPLEPEHILVLWKKLLASGLVVLFGYWQGSRLLGMVGGVLWPSLWRRGLNVQELCWYVDPNRRGVPVGLKLLRALEAWAMECGATEMFLIDLVKGHDGMRNAAFYERLGYTLKESCYRRELASAFTEAEREV